MTSFLFYTWATGNDQPNIVSSAPITEATSMSISSELQRSLKFSAMDPLYVVNPHFHRLWWH